MRRRAHLLAIKTCGFFQKSGRKPIFQTLFWVPAIVGWNCAVENEASTVPSPMIRAKTAYWFSSRRSLCGRVRFKGVPIIHYQNAGIRSKEGKLPLPSHIFQHRLFLDHWPWWCCFLLNWSLSPDDQLFLGRL